MLDNSSHYRHRYFIAHNLLPCSRSKACEKRRTGIRLTSSDRSWSLVFRSYNGCNFRWKKQSQRPVQSKCTLSECSGQWQSDDSWRRRPNSCQIYHWRHHEQRNRGSARCYENHQLTPRQMIEKMKSSSFAAEKVLRVSWIEVILEYISDLKNKTTIFI